MAPENYAALPTERAHPRSNRLDLLTPIQIIRLMNQEDRQVLRAIGQSQIKIALAVRLIADAFHRGNRIVFVGAGTSGRLGVLEAAECPPTFNTSPTVVQAIMAGGKKAVFRSQEGAEDSENEARMAIRRRVRAGDVVIGIAASGVTPYVQSALRTAKGLKALRILVTCNPKTPPGLSEVTIALRTGPEVLSGSTRLKAGTACKMVLNMLTTASMVQWGKVYGNRMVDLQPRSKKLVERGVRLIGDLGRVGGNESRRLLKESHGHVKIAIVMARKKLSYLQAFRELRKAHGQLRKIL